MAAFGDELRRERELRGMPVEAICQATKVSAKHILALEAGDFRQLPGGVFRRGFVRSYLSALGLEQDPWMRRFEESCRENGVGEPAGTEWMTFAENVRNSRPVRGRRMGAKWLAAALILVAIALAGWCGWRLAKHRSLLPQPLLWTAPNSWVDNASSR